MKKTLILISLIAFNLNASEFQMIDGTSAYELYKSLPGTTCTEWSSADLVVYTKYQTAKCGDQNENSQWVCTVQLKKKNKNNKESKLLSASCTREI